MSGPSVRRIAMAVKHPFAVPRVTPHPAEDHLVAHGAMDDIVREGVGDVRLKLHDGAGRKGVPPLPTVANRAMSKLDVRDY